MATRSLTSRLRPQLRLPYIGRAGSANRTHDQQLGRLRPHHEDTRNTEPPSSVALAHDLYRRSLSLRCSGLEPAEGVGPSSIRIPIVALSERYWQCPVGVAIPLRVRQTFSLASMRRQIVDPKRIERSLAVCKTAVLPLNDRPKSIFFC